jgi:hypothetical protein
MSNFTKMIHNVETNEIEIIELSDEEQTQLKAERADWLKARIQAKTETAAKKQAAEAKLAALGLTVEDLQALGL